MFDFPDFLFDFNSAINFYWVLMVHYSSVANLDKSSRFLLVWSRIWTGETIHGQIYLIFCIWREMKRFKKGNFHIIRSKIKIQ